MTQETTFGASIVSKDDKPRSQLTTSASSDSLAADSQIEKEYPPYSPFYQHPPASHERVSKSLSRKNTLDINVVEKGLESSELTPMTTQTENPFSSKISLNNCNKECQMWPSRQTIVDAKMQDKKKKRSARFCACAGPRHSWEQLHKNHRLTVRLVIALFLVAAMVGLGVGISKAVHGSYYNGNGSSTST